MPIQTIIPPASLRELITRSERVFPMYPQVARYFPASSIEGARQKLGRAIERGDGPGLIVGGAGIGKSLLLQVMAAQFRERFDVVLLACARVCTRRALLQAILFELGLPYRQRDEGELRLSLLDHLLSAEKCPEGLLVLVDEAQSLSPALLDELRVMTNLIRGGSSRVRLVLAGSAALEETFASPELESFSQRLSARCYLAPFNREETTQFIRAQIAASGGTPDEVFAGDAYAAVFHATDGVPRLVNQLCDRALLLADSQDRHQVRRDLVQAAWADLQQLPAPWDSSTTTICSASSADIVEFGGLQLDSATADFTSESCTDVEARELETEDATPEAIVVTRVPEVAEPLAANVCRSSEVSIADPFAERFDEEEVVIDGFAAWDDMFRRDAPRVENRRDPAFANLVQLAMDASPDAPKSTYPTIIDVPDESRYQPQECALFAFEDSSPQKRAIDASPEEDEPASPISEEWTGLRLAVLSDPIPLRPIPIVAPVSRSTSTPYEPGSRRSSQESADWPEPTDFSTAAAVFSGSFVGAARERVAPVEDQVLVIEDDTLIPSLEEPPVRHEDYCHLFSRLRSG
jgi:type II secretory pathway predicted ATPase ExeA